MSGEILIIIALVIVLVVTIVFIEIRDKEINKRLDAYGRTIEDLSKDIHELKKKFNDHLFGNVVVTKVEKDKIDERVESEVQNKIMPLKQSLKEVKIITKEFQEKYKKQSDINEEKETKYSVHAENFDENIKTEDKIKQPQEDAQEADLSEIIKEIEEQEVDFEEQVLELFDRGRDISDIAELLGLEESEVEFILDLNDKNQK